MGNYIQYLIITYNGKESEKEFYRYPWDFPGKNTGVDCHFLLQEIFMNQGLILCLPCLLHSALQMDSLPSEPSGKPVCVCVCVCVCVRAC